MAANLQERINKIEAKAALMVERYGLMRDALADAHKRIDELEAVIVRQKRELQERDRQIEYLKVASVRSRSLPTIAMSRPHVPCLLN